MNLQSLVAVVLRLIALDFFLRSGISVIPHFINMMITSGRPASETAVLTRMLPVFAIVVLFVIAVLLWVFAPSIGRLVVRGIPPNLSLGETSLADCYSVAFIGVGLLYVAGNFANVLTWAHYLLKMAASETGNSWKEQFNGYDAAQVFIQFIVGLVLVVNGRKWALALARKHGALKPIVGPPESESEVKPASP